VDIPRGKAGYQERICESDVGLKEVRTEVGYGGFVWVNLDDSCGPLSEHIGSSLDYMLPELEAEPLEVLWYYQATLRTNFKLIHDTNSEFYHDYLHYHNRITGMLDPKSGYFQRKYTAFPNGHASVGSMNVSYDAYTGSGHSKLGWPKLPTKAGSWWTFFRASIQPAHFRITDRLLYSARPGSCHSRVPHTGPQERHPGNTPTARERCGHDLEPIRS